MNFKKIIGAAALSVAAVGLAACGGNQTTSTVQPKSTPSKGTSTPSTSKSTSYTSVPRGTTQSGKIKFYASSGDNLKPVLQLAIAQFQAACPGWTVDLQTPGGYDAINEKINADLMAEQQPNLAFCYGDHVAGYLKSGKVLDFDPYINDGEYGLSADDIQQMKAAGYYDEGTVFAQEGRFTMPLNKSTDIVYINKTVCDPVFKKLGIDPDNHVNWTWDKLWEAGAELKRMYPSSTPIGYDSEANWAITYLEQVSKQSGKKLYTDKDKAGADKIQFNNDETFNMFKMAYDQRQKGVLTTKGVSGSYTSGLFVKYDQSKESDSKYASSYDGSFISIGSSGGASHQKPANSSAFTVSVAESPSIDGTDNTLKMISQGPSLVMFDSGDDAVNLHTWMFTTILLSKEIQAAYALASEGYSPVRADATALVLSNENCSEINKTVLALIEKITANNGARNIFYTSDCFDGSAISRVQLGNALIAVLKDTSGKDPEDLIDSALQTAADEARTYAK